MTFAEAAKFMMPFGKYKDMQLDSIAEEDSGLKYLDWLRNERLENNDTLSDVDTALATYLSDESIMRELENL